MLNTLKNVLGWGKTMRNQVIPTMFLQTAPMKIYSSQQCKKHYSFIRVSHLCAGPWTRGEFTCDGDSGGPLSISGDDGREFQIGVISVGKEGICKIANKLTAGHFLMTNLNYLLDCGFKGDPTVFTRVDRFISWIRQHTR